MRNIKFLNSTELIANQLENENRWATARNYRSTIRSFRKFLTQSTGKSDIDTKRLNHKILYDYQQWLYRRGVKANSSSFYMRILRAAYNKIIGHSAGNQIFQSVYTGIAKTRKRAIEEDTILKINNLEHTKSQQIELARDIFVFSYAMRGMAFVDIAFLRKSDISAGRISYIRRKTSQLLTIKIEPIAQRIIKKYAAQTVDSQFVFPIIKTDDAREAHNQYRKALNQYNRNLLILSKLIDSEIHISSYTARHSWATAARRHNIPLSVISAGMGHTSERTTLIYLDSIETTKIDKANKEILAPLNKKFS